MAAETKKYSEAVWFLSDTVHINGDEIGEDLQPCDKNIVLTTWAK